MEKKRGLRVRGTGQEYLRVAPWLFQVGVRKREPSEPDGGKRCDEKEKDKGEHSYNILKFSQIEEEGGAARDAEGH